MDEQRSKVLKVVLASGSFAIIVVGVAVALAGQWFGWLIAAFGALDAAAIPFVLRAIEAQGAGSRRSAGPEEATATPDPGSAGGTAAEPTADPSYNPYARED